MGCPAREPDAVRAARREWSDALCGSGIAEPRLREEQDLGIKEYVNGCLQPPGTVKFSRGCETYSDGSCKFVGTRFAVASGAVIQFGRGGILRVSCGCVPRDLPQSAVSGEPGAVALLDLVLGKGCP